MFSSLFKIGQANGILYKYFIWISRKAATILKRTARSLSLELCVGLLDEVSSRLIAFLALNLSPTYHHHRLPYHSCDIIVGICIAVCTLGIS